MYLSGHHEWLYSQSFNLFQTVDAKYFTGIQSRETLPPWGYVTKQPWQIVVCSMTQSDEYKSGNMCICCPICIGWLFCLATFSIPLQSCWSGITLKEMWVTLLSQCSTERSCAHSTCTLRAVWHSYRLFSDSIYCFCSYFIYLLRFHIVKILPWLDFMFCSNVLKVS